MVAPVRAAPAVVGGWANPVARVDRSIDVRVASRPVYVEIGGQVGHSRPSWSIADARSVVDAWPAADARPIVDTRPVIDTRSAANARLATHTRSVADTGLTAYARSISDARLATDRRAIAKARSGGKRGRAPAAGACSWPTNTGRRPAGKCRGASARSTGERRLLRWSGAADSRATRESPASVATPASDKPTAATLYAASCVSTAATEAATPAATEATTASPAASAHGDGRRSKGAC